MAVPLEKFWLSLCAPLKFQVTDRLWLELILISKEFCLQVYIEDSGGEWTFY